MWIKLIFNWLRGVWPWWRDDPTFRSLPTEIEMFGRRICTRPYWGTENSQVVENSAATISPVQISTVRGTPQWRTHCERKPTMTMIRFVLAALFLISSVVEGRPLVRNIRSTHGVLLFLKILFLIVVTMATMWRLTSSFLPCVRVRSPFRKAHDWDGAPCGGWFLQWFLWPMSYDGSNF